MPTLEAVEVARIVEQTRLIRASRARIFEAWINPVLLKDWFGPADRVCVLAESDPRVGGAYRIGVRLKDDPNAPVAIASGQYLEIVPSRRLKFNWLPTWNPGEESLVTVTLEHVTGGTEVTLRHEQFPPESFTNYNIGWEGSLTKLAHSTERF